MYLMCITDDGEIYIPITDNQQTKIQKLIETKQVPKRLTINGRDIESRTILGFTETNPNAAPEMKSWDDLRSWVQKQAWYKGSNRTPQPEGGNREQTELYHDTDPPKQDTQGFR